MWARLDGDKRFTPGALRGGVRLEQLRRADRVGRQGPARGPSTGSGPTGAPARDVPIVSVIGGSEGTAAHCAELRAPAASYEQSGRDLLTRTGLGARVLAHGDLLESAADYSPIGSAATGSGATAGRLRDADVAGPLSSVQDSLAGSQTSQAGLWVATRLGAAVQVFPDDLESMGQLATATMDSYDHTDSVHAATIRRAAR